MKEKLQVFVAFWQRHPVLAPAVAITAFATLLMLYEIGAQIKEEFDRRAYQKAQTELKNQSTAKEKEAEDAKRDADENRGKAQELERQLGDAKRKLDAARAAYEDAKRRADEAGKGAHRGPVGSGDPGGDDSDRALCERANSLGVECARR